MINDKTMLPRVNSDLVFIENIEEKFGGEFHISHYTNSKKLEDLINFYGNKMDEDIAAGILDTKYLKMFEILVNIQNGVVYR